MLATSGDDLLLMDSRGDVVDGDLVTYGERRLFVRRADGQEIEVPRPASSKQMQTSGGDLHDGLVVWRDTSSANAFLEPWTIVSYDLGTGQHLTIASDLREDVPTPPSQEGPQLAAGRVYWEAATSTGNAQRPATTAIYSRDTGAKEPVRLEVQDGWGLIVDSSTMWYVLSGFTRPEMGQRVELHSRDLGTGKDTVVRTMDVPADLQLSGFAATRDALSWLVAGNPDASLVGDDVPHTDLYVDRGGVVTRFHAPNAALGSLRSSDRWLGLSDGTEKGELFAVDLESLTPISLGFSPGFFMVLPSGQNLIWRQDRTWFVRRAAAD